jgi:hypothetical protein
MIRSQEGHSLYLDIDASFRKDNLPESTFE